MTCQMQPAEQKNEVPLQQWPCSLPYLPMPDADHGAKSTSSTSSCPASPAVTGVQLRSYPLRAGLVLAAGPG